MSVADAASSSAMDARAPAGEEAAMSLSVSLPASVTRFWREAGPKRWYAKDDAFDGALRTRFGALHHAAAQGELADWLAAPESALAFLLLTDQIPRNIFRGSAHAFATDGLARAAARMATGRSLDQAVEPLLRQFFYMPFMHSEAIEDHRHAAPLFEAYAADADGGETLRYARMHAEIIERFGRFPHRNAVMGRSSTPEEEAFLAAGGFKG